MILFDKTVRALSFVFENSWVYSSHCTYILFFQTVIDIEENQAGMEEYGNCMRLAVELMLFNLGAHNV